MGNSKTNITVNKRISFKLLSNNCTVYTPNTILTPVQVLTRKKRNFNYLFSLRITKRYYIFTESILLFLSLKIGCKYAIEKYKR